MQIPKVNFSIFVNEKLAEGGFRIELLTKQFMSSRLRDVSNVVNQVRIQYTDLYGWKKENDEYFLKDLPGKWQFSYVVLDANSKICMVCINSIKFKNSLHFHAVYVKDKYRNKNLTKFVLIKAAQTALENRIEKLDLYCHKNNLSALSLYMRTGFEVKMTRNENEILMVADTNTVRENCYKMIISENRKFKNPA